MKPFGILLGSSLFFLQFNKIDGQTSWDAEMMSKKEICFAGVYSNDTWTEYWESQLIRDNQNIGTFKRSVGTFMTAYGFGKKVNLIAGVNYVNTTSTQGTVAGNSGLQDISLHAKYNFIDKSYKSFGVKAFMIAGGSIPTNSYNADAGPFSIGLGCKELNGRATIEFVHRSGLFLRTHYSHHLRGITAIDRNYYYDVHGYYTNEITMPQMNQYAGTLGLRTLSNRLRVETAYISQNTLGGSEIRRNDMPIASANMDVTMISFFVKYDPEFVNGFGILVGANKVLSGANVGKSTNLSFGLTYRFSFINTKLIENEK